MEDKALRVPENYRIGPYKADYSEPDLSAWRAVDLDLEDLISNSISIAKFRIPT